MTNLQEVGAAFKHYRGKRKHVHYPEDLWDQAVILAETYPKILIAETLNISFSFLNNTDHPPSREELLQAALEEYEI